MGRASLVAVLVLVFAGLVPAVASSGSASMRVRVLATNAVGGPELAGGRIAWLKPAGPGCAGLAVRELATRRRHDLGSRVCPNEGIPPIFAYGGDTAFWVADYCGNECYQELDALTPQRAWSGEADWLSTDNWGIGTAIASIAADARHVLYLENEYRLPPGSTDACVEAETCSVVASRSTLTSVTGGGGRKLRAPAVAIALHAGTLALERPDGTVELRDLRTWRLARTLDLREPGALFLSPSYLGVRGRDGFVVYDRRSGAVVLDADVGEAFVEGFSDAGVVYAEEDAIVVTRVNGPVLRMAATHHRYADWPSAAIDGRTLAWREGRTVRVTTLPR